MAFFGLSGGGGLLGGLGGNTNGPAPRPIIGIGANLLGQSINADILSAAVRFSNTNTPAVNLDISEENIATPFDQEDTRSLSQRIREVRELSEFIDLNDDRLEAVENNPDRQATFATFIALDRLRTLAEFAADEDTPEVTLARLDEQFQQGLSEVRNFINAAELDQLDLFVGDREFRADSTARLGTDNRDFEGSLVASDPDTAIEGLTGNEIFTVSISTRSAANNSILDTNDITIDLSNVSGTLSLNNIVDFINQQIEAIPQLDSDGNPAFDSDGNPISDNQTRFQVNSEGGRFGIEIDGILLEDVRFSAAVNTPSLFVSSSVTQAGDDISTARITEFTNLSGSITTDNTIAFAATDLAATEIQELTADLDEDGDEIDPAIAAQRDEILAQARIDVLGQDEVDRLDAEEADSDDDTNIFDITNINSDVRVNAETSANRIAVDSEGNIFTVGTSSGSFGNQINTASENDVFLTRFDQAGNVVFSRLLGSSEDADAFAITIDSNDNVIIAGQTDNALVENDIFDGAGDAFVASFTNQGTENFRFQLDTFSETSGLTVTTDSNNDIILGGFARSSINASTSFGGGRDGLLLRLDGTTGSVQDSNLIGGATNEQISAVTTDSNGNILIASEENGEAVIRRFDASNLTNELSSINLGALGAGGSISGIAVDGNTIVISGTVQGNGLNAGTVVGSTTGGLDGFVIGLSDDGTSLNPNFTTFISTTGTDNIADVTISGGNVFVAGTTAGTLSGEASIGADDGFVARINASTGAIEDQEQFGVNAGADSAVSGVAFTQQGSSVLDTLGLTQGTVNAPQQRDITTQTSAREGDFFFIEVEGEPRRRIEIQAGDTFDDLARRIRISAFRDLDVSVRRGSEGEGLRIETIRDARAVTLIAGTDGQNALERLGIPEGRLLPQNEIFGDSSDDDSQSPEEELGGAFGLGIDGALNIRDAATARFVLSQLDNAISEIQRADRSLEFNPFRDLLTSGLGANADGPVNPRTLSQIANFQTALARLQAGNPSSGLLI
ncbi:SBBP repeat-containing protein [Kordiimonas sp. SCSIO 12610]|uniref:SBBP repeat-containing protein n=1 Tax=Kordiimonas sp. SCSIO 12610 TaxID=2829597 RepID=UPI00210BC082|nr:SBBP repeat-containing protein [Kordiimonas sp. SCSIO 12610]UTW55606.1 SBBP repeat-containing protein [Kordiimonas sp. SCSIO 12610]